MSNDHRGAIDSITVQLIEKYQPEKIILFGSFARGDATPGRDVDLLIIKRDTLHYGADRIMEVSRLIERDVPSQAEETRRPAEDPRPEELKGAAPAEVLSLPVGVS